MWMWAALVACGAVLISLYSGRVVTLSLLAMFLVAVALTFVLPKLHAPGGVGSSGTGTL